MKTFWRTPKHEDELLFGAAVETTRAKRREMREARQAPASGESWETWAKGVGDYLGDLEAWRRAWFDSKDRGPDDIPVIAEIIAEVQHDAEEKLATAVTALRAEAQIELSIVRDEILSKLDAKIFGSALDYDPDRVRQSIHELRRDLNERSKSVDARFDELAERHKKSERLRRDQVVKIAILEARLKGLPAPQIKITGWKIDAAAYTATPQMSDGSIGPLIDFRPMFEAYFAETAP